MYILHFFVSLICIFDSDYYRMCSLTIECVSFSFLLATNNFNCRQKDNAIKAWREFVGPTNSLMVKTLYVLICMCNLNCLPPT